MTARAVGEIDIFESMKAPPVVPVKLQMRDVWPDRLPTVRSQNRYANLDHWPLRVNHSKVPAELLKALRAGFLGGAFAWPLFVFGESGAGKTAACAGFVGRVRGGLYEEGFQFCDMIVAARMGKITTHGTHASSTMLESELWKVWEHASITCMDELDARASVTDTRLEIVKRAIDLRENKPSIWIANIGLEDLAKIYDDRITSRLSAGVWVEVSGDQRGGK